MDRGILRRSNEHGEWSVVDKDLGYRICAFNHQGHGGVHVHDWATGAVHAAVGIEDDAEAYLFARHFRREVQVFTVEAFRKELRRWKSK